MNLPISRALAAKATPAAPQSSYLVQTNRPPPPPNYSSPLPFIGGDSPLWTSDGKVCAPELLAEIRRDASSSASRSRRLRKNKTLSISNKGEQLGISTTLGEHEAAWKEEDEYAIGCLVIMIVPLACN